MSETYVKGYMGIMTSIATADPNGFDNTWLAALKIGDITFYSDKAYSTYDSARRKSRKIVALLSREKKDTKDNKGKGKKC